MTRRDLETTLAAHRAQASDPDALEVEHLSEVLALAWDETVRPALEAMGVATGRAVLAPLIRNADVNMDGVLSDEEQESLITQVLAVVVGGAAAAAFAGRVGDAFDRVRDAYLRSLRTTAPTLSDAPRFSDLSDLLQSLPPARPLARGLPGTIPQRSGPSLRAGVVIGGPDRLALAWLDRYTGYWITQGTQTKIAPLLGETARRYLDGASGLDQVAEAMRRTLAGHGRTPGVVQRGLSYWRIVAQATISRAQAMGRLRAFEAAGVERVRVSIVDDHRTSEVSRFMRGRTMRVSEMQRVRSSLLAGTTPEQWKRAAPWWTDRDVAPGGALRRLVEANGGEIPAAAGLIPWHPSDRDRFLPDLSTP